MTTFQRATIRGLNLFYREAGSNTSPTIASKHPDAIEGIVVQNGNAYVEGIGAAFDPMKPFWVNRNRESEKPVRDLLNLRWRIPANSLRSKSLRSLPEARVSSLRIFPMNYQKG